MKQLNYKDFNIEFSNENITTDPRGWIMEISRLGKDMKISFRVIFVVHFEMNLETFGDLERSRLMIKITLEKKLCLSDSV